MVDGLTYSLYSFLISPKIQPCFQERIFLYFEKIKSEEFFVLSRWTHLKLFKKFLQVSDIDPEQARQHYQQSIKMAKSDRDKLLLQEKNNELK
jgi:hypothetical protein